MDKIGLFFGPIGGSTDKVGKKIAKAFGEDHIEFVPVKAAGTAELDKYDKIIFGISTLGRETWDGVHTKNDWDVFMPTLSEVDFSSKKVALYGLGDSVTYAQYFVDHMGVLAEILLAQNANIIGRCSTEGYTFEDSQAIYNDEFIGLPVDEDFEDYLTDERIEAWIENIKLEFGF
jgi:flavodoxin I